MEVRACRGCRRLFNYLAGDLLCPECKEKLEKKFQEVKEYIEENSGTDTKQVARDCKVEISQIKKWIREERLHVVDERDVYSICEHCGKIIPSGNFCAACKNQLLRGVGEAIKGDVVSEVKERKPRLSKSQMRFISH